MWRQPTNDDLVAVISQKELDQYRKSAEWTDDPIGRLLSNTVAAVRGFIRSGRKCALGPEGTLPDSLIPSAMDYAAFDIVKRIDDVGESRTKAYDRACQMFDRVASGEFIPEAESDATAEDEKVITTPSTLPADPPRLLD